MPKKLVIAGLMAILMIRIFVSCTSRPDVVGQWQRVDGDDKLTFSKDGTFKAVDSMGAAAAGRYALHADGTLYFAVTHKDGMQPQIKPVEDLKVNIVGVQFHRDRPEITIITDEAATVRIYRRIEPPAKPVY